MKAFLGKIENVFTKSGLQSDLQSDLNGSNKNPDERRFSFLDYEINFSMKKRSQSSSSVNSKTTGPPVPPPPPPPRYVTLNVKFHDLYGQHFWQKVFTLYKKYIEIISMKPMHRLG